MALPISSSLITLPPVDLSNSVIVTPSSYATWGACFTANPGKDILVGPGNYHSWGRLARTDKPGGTLALPQVVRYYNPGVDDDVHPAQRSNHALVNACLFAKSLTANWYVYGLTFRATDEDTYVQEGASNITFDYCLWENNGTRGYNIRLRACTDVTVQRSVIRNTLQTLDVDSTGVYVNGIEGHTTRYKILDSEIYNVGDCIQISNAATGAPPTWQVDGLIEGNDLYVDPSLYDGTTNTTNLENAIDIKTGSTAANSTHIVGNRMWGFRRNSGVVSSFGEAIVVQHWSQNVLIENNIIGDCPYGLKVESWPAGYATPNQARNVTVSNNQFYGIRDYATADSGAVMRNHFDVTFNDNFVSNCDALEVVLAAYKAGGPTYARNVLRQVAAIQNPDSITATKYVASSNTTAGIPDYGYATYERQRWTGVLTADGALPADAPPAVEEPDSITDNPHGDPPVATVPVDPVVVIVYADTASHRGGRVPQGAVATGSVSHRSTHVED